MSTSSEVQERWFRERCDARIGNRHLDLGTRANAKTSPDRGSRDYRPNCFSIILHRLPHSQVARICLHPLYSNPLVTAKQHFIPLLEFGCATHLDITCLSIHELIPFLVFVKKHGILYRRLRGLFITMSQDTGLFSIKRPREV
jgi:hypothetical protein